MRNLCDNLAGRGLRVLLVEDSLVAAQMVVIQLQQGMPECEVVTANSLAKTMAALNDGEFSVVLLDLNLPDSAGLDTFVTVQSHSRKTPVVILSGDNDQEMAVEAVSGGAQDYLVKTRFDHEHLSRSIRFAVERTQRLRIEQEVSNAKTIQDKLFPESAPSLPGYDVAGAAFAAEQLSGDYFDYIRMSDGKLGIVIGDVSGHGFAPALLMAETRAYLHALTYSSGNGGAFADGADLGQVLERTNKLLAATPNWLFVTLFFLCLDPRTSSYTYASAGHRILHFDADGNCHKRDSTGPALGLSEDLEFEMAGPIPMNVGDVLFLGTDGFEEAEGASGLFGVDGISIAVKEKSDAGSKALIEHTWLQARQFADSDTQLDDMTAVVVRRLE